MDGSSGARARRPARALECLGPPKAKQACAFDWPAPLGLFWEVRGHFARARPAVGILSTERPKGKRLPAPRYWPGQARICLSSKRYPATLSLAGESLQFAARRQAGVAYRLISSANCRHEGDYATAQAIWTSADDLEPR